MQNKTQKYIDKYYKKIQLISTNKSKIIGATIVILCIMSIVVLNKVLPTAVSGQQYIILATNDLGMHCIQKDYSDFMILPPANNLRVQVFKKGDKRSALITKGINVKYEIIDNTKSSNKINFWKYSKQYGYDVKPDVGITGNTLSGQMVLSADKKYFEATAIPVTPYTDSNPTKLSPYQVAKITVYDDKTGKLIAMTDSVVVPVSTEMNCADCHGTINTGLSILESHDKLSGTFLVQDLNNDIRHKCSDCHRDNAIGQPGKEGVSPLSQAMHGFHDTKMQLTPTTPQCYTCHPGPATQCYRGVMMSQGVSCDDPKCHGTMDNIAQSQKAGRQAWLEEPNCGMCHTQTYASNSDSLYRNSYLQNSPDKDMNDIILCASCHNSPHAEWPSTLPIDNALPNSLLGSSSYINQCTVCHNGEGKVHKKEIK